jgi:hypothetical protein
MTARKPETKPPADKPPSNGVEPAPAPAQAPECIHCKKHAAFLGEVTLDRIGWWLHASCRRAVMAEVEAARRR